jgi:hypothetical protein
MTRRQSAHTSRSVGPSWWSKRWLAWVGPREACNFTGVATPPVSVLRPLGLSSWRLPAGWLSLTVALPSGLAAWLAWRRSRWAPLAVLVASALLATELLFQIPSLGFSVLRLIFGTVAIGMAAVAFLARKAGWRPRARPTTSL